MNLPSQSPFAALLPDTARTTSVMSQQALGVIVPRTISGFAEDILRHAISEINEPKPWARTTVDRFWGLVHAICFEQGPLLEFQPAHLLARVALLIAPSEPERLQIDLLLVRLTEWEVIDFLVQAHVLQPSVEARGENLTQRLISPSQQIAMAKLILGLPHPTASHMALLRAFVLCARFSDRDYDEHQESVFLPAFLALHTHEGRKAADVYGRALIDLYENNRDSTTLLALQNRKYAGGVALVPMVFRVLGPDPDTQTILEMSRYCCHILETHLQDDKTLHLIASYLGAHSAELPTADFLGWLCQRYLCIPDEQKRLRILWFLHLPELEPFLSQRSVALRDAVLEMSDDGCSCLIHSPSSPDYGRNDECEILWSLGKYFNTADDCYHEYFRLLGVTLSEDELLSYDGYTYSDSGEMAIIAVMRGFPRFLDVAIRLYADYDVSLLQQYLAEGDTSKISPHIRRLLLMYDLDAKHTTNELQLYAKPRSKTFRSLLLMQGLGDPKLPTSPQNSFLGLLFADLPDALREDKEMDRMPLAVFLYWLNDKALSRERPLFVSETAKEVAKNGGQQFYLVDMLERANDRVPFSQYVLTNFLVGDALPRDVVIRTACGSYRVHSCFLRALSPTFDNLYSSFLESDSNPTRLFPFHIVDSVLGPHDQCVLQLLIYIIYCPGTPQIIQDGHIAALLLRTMDFLGVKELEQWVTKVTGQFSHVEDVVPLLNEVVYLQMNSTVVSQIVKKLHLLTVSATPTAPPPCLPQGCPHLVWNGEIQWWSFCFCSSPHAPEEKRFMPVLTPLREKRKTEGGDVGEQPAKLVAMEEGSGSVRLTTAPKCDATL